MRMSDKVFAGLWVFSQVSYIALGHLPNNTHAVSILQMLSQKLPLAILLIPVKQATAHALQDMGASGIVKRVWSFAIPYVLCLGYQPVQEELFKKYGGIFNLSSNYAETSEQNTVNNYAAAAFGAAISFFAADMLRSSNYHGEVTTPLLALFIDSVARYCFLEWNKICSTNDEKLCSTNDEKCRKSRYDMVNIVNAIAGVAIGINQYSRFIPSLADAGVSNIARLLFDVTTSAAFKNKQEYCYRDILTPMIKFGLFHLLDTPLCRILGMKSAGIMSAIACILIAFQDASYGRS
jgi:hypothetical protein